MSETKWRFSHLLALLSIFSLSTAWSQTGVAVKVNATGLSSLTYNGTEFLSYGDLRVNRVSMRNPGGGTTDAVLTGTSTVDAGGQSITKTYSWGTVNVAYVPAGNRLNLTITTRNTSSTTIQGTFYEIFGLHFPNAVTEYDGSIPLIASNVGDPSLIQMSYGSGALVLANEDVQKPLIVGFPWALDKPTNTVFPLRVNTDREGMYPDRVPYVDRPIAPGSSDTYQLSLRFGPTGSSIATLAPDIYQKFAAVYPKTLQWADRRAVGTLFLSSAAIGSSTNPRGWFNDPSIDVTTPAGVAKLRTQVLAWADNSIAVLKDMNAQGMITWDIEGQQFAHPTSYVGDPRVFTATAPEMTGIADDYFKKFRDAGLRVGVCLRAQQFTLAPDGKSATQTELPDPTQLLIDKITYAKNRWGATLFYVDSNGDPAAPYDVNIFRKAAAAFPDVLLIPEHKNTQYYAYTAPYMELRQGFVSTPAQARAIYPSAFSFVNTQDGAIDQHFAELSAAVKQGDVMLFRGWWPDPANAKVKALYGTVSVAPTVSITSPANGATVSGVIAVTANATGSPGVAGVQFKLDGGNFGAEIASPPFSVSINTTTLAAGNHTLTATVRDTGNNMVISSPVTVNVNNPVAIGCTAPQTNAFTGCYYSDQNLGALKLVRTDPQINFNWGGAAPDPSLSGQRFSVKWLGNFTFEAASYQFSATADDGMRVYVDDQLLIDGWRDQYATAYTGTRALTAGTHLVRVEYYQQGGFSTAILSWAKMGDAGQCPAPAVNSFTGCYYSDQTFTTLAGVRNDNQINFHWGSNAPLAGMNHEHFSIRWQGVFTFETAGYNFYAVCDDGIRIYVDGQPVIDSWKDQWPAGYSGVIYVPAGTHTVRVDYYQNTMEATAEISWQRR